LFPELPKRDNKAAVTHFMK